MISDLKSNLLLEHAYSFRPWFPALRLGTTGLVNLMRRTINKGKLTYLICYGIVQTWCWIGPIMKFWLVIIYLYSGIEKMTKSTCYMCWRIGFFSANENLQKAPMTYDLENVPVSKWVWIPQVSCNIYVHVLKALHDFK